MSDARLLDGLWADAAIQRTWAPYVPLDCLVASLLAMTRLGAKHFAPV